MEILDHLDPLLRMFWLIAIPVSLIFIIQTIMTFAGASAADGMNADIPDSYDGGDMPFQLFSLRNLINFLLGFSWTGISFYSAISNQILLIIAALAVGILFIYLFFAVIKQFQKLAEDNSFKIASTLHKSAEVYLTIPARKSGKGKIMISVNGAFHELNAMTENETIPTGQTVKVVNIESGNVLIVEKI